MLGAAALAGAAAVAFTQAASLGTLIDVRQVLTAGFAKGLVLGYGVAVAGIVVVTLLAPARWLKAPVYASAGLAAALLCATLLVGGEIWSMTMAGLTMAACWQAGVWLLQAARQARLATIPAVAWLAGVAPVGLWELGIGRAGLLTWWLAGVPVLAVGAYGTAQLLQRCRGGRARAAIEHVTGGRVPAACAAVVLLGLGLASVWTAAPEIMFDALYGKAWLPAEWSRLGEIAPLTIHPVLNTVGFAQLLAVPGHLLGADGVGRYLQWLAVGAVVASIWHAKWRSPWAPVAAAAIAVTPQLFWQATTAFDDGLIVLGALALALAVVSVIDGEGPSPIWTAAAIGWLAGALVDLKLHATALAVGLVLGWWVFGRIRSCRAAAAAVAGGVASAAWPFALRWLDTGNPVLPAWNNVFRSSYWPAVNEKFNFPFLHDPGAFGPLSVIVRSVTDPVALNEAAPIGSFGLLMPALVLALVFGLVALVRDRKAARGSLALWLGVLLAFAAWYLQFRYLRYLLPAGVVSVLMLLGLSWDQVQSRTVQAAAILAVGVSAIALWPATVAQFWNVPGKDLPIEAALGLQNQQEYERASMPERDALEAFNRLAPPGARAVATAHERLFLRAGRDLSPDWEVAARARTKGGLPTDPDALLRRYRQLGITWVITTFGTPFASDRSVRALLARHGELMYRDGTASVYRLANRPRALRPVGACNPQPTSDPGCWQGTLDRRPGYSYAESPAGISRQVPACPGQVVAARVSVPRNSPPVNASITFDGHAVLGRVGFAIVQPGTTGELAAPAPSDAKGATVAVAGPPGSIVGRATVGVIGPCRGR